MEQNVINNVISQLRQLIEVKKSLNKTATALGVSSATLSKITSGKIDDISDDMWRSLSAKLGVSTTGKKKWQVAVTTTYKQLMFVLEQSQNESIACAVTGDAGCGKTTTATEYANTHAEVALLTCAEFWNRKKFMISLLTAFGVDSDGMSVGEMMDAIVEKLKRTENPLIILDEADKLSDSILYFFITLYNQLEDCCGIVLMATDFLKKRIEKGVRCCKKGYKEIYSRIGRKFILLPTATLEDVANACSANNVEAEKDINRIWADASGDFRRVKRACWATLKKSA